MNYAMNMVQPEQMGMNLYRAAKMAQANHNLVEAEACYRQGIALDPYHHEAIYDFGNMLKEQNRVADAEMAYRTALALCPASAQILYSLGVLLAETNRLVEAEAAFLSAIAVGPQYAEVHGALGFVRERLNRLPEAEESFRTALSIRPDSAEAMFNLGYVLRAVNKLSEAEVAYRNTLLVRQDYLDAKWNLASLLLKRGQYEEGWRLYETRFAPGQPLAHVYACAIATSSSTEWKGESLVGKSMVVWCEQGFGDCLQFARYLPLLKTRGLLRLTVVCAPALVRLFSGIEGVDCVVPDNQGVPYNTAPKLPAHDVWCFIMSLPLLFETRLESIPAQMSYLRVPEECARIWADVLPKQAGRLKVGIAWAGSKKLQNDSARSLDLNTLLPLLRCSNVSFVSLQADAEPRSQIKAIVKELRPFDPMDEVEDFADTAAIIEQLDLVIAVDTAVVHLAGAMNKPVWVLSRFNGCWRWLHDRDDSPWYPSVHLFRQTEVGQWGDVIERVAAELQRF